MSSSTFFQAHRPRSPHLPRLQQTPHSPFPSHGGLLGAASGIFLPSPLTPQLWLTKGRNRCTQFLLRNSSAFSNSRSQDVVTDEGGSDLGTAGLHGTGTPRRPETQRGLGRTQLRQGALRPGSYAHVATYFTRMSGKWKKDIDVSVRSMTLMILIRQTGTRTAPSGHAHGRPGSWGPGDSRPPG